ncbi:MAG: DNA gyrase subunit A [Anaerolineae bacterium]|nr:DNA gyrase subunit A [Anaerolineae bacterium]
MEIGIIKQVDIQQEMQSAYLDYAMSVIVARALPDVRDGLKPVHRRILYAMYDMGLTADKPYKKSARIVGEVLGKYHPHGDAAVYDAMVRMAQDFSLRYPLVDGQGNFGSIDGDNAAAMRYTEARLQRLAEEMLADIDKETVDFVPNFDGTLQEPSVLPAALPNLLVNGASGIAVGMATNIPPHNLGEVCDALCYLIDHYDRAEDVTVQELMRFIKGPDFPTGGILYRYSAEGGHEREDLVARAYASGRGHFRVQARAHIEEMSRGRSRIVVTELPYQVNKTNLIERIAELAREGRIEGISDLRDESDRTGMRLVIELTRTADPRAVLAELYKLTPMQQTFSLSMLALVDGEPRVLSLRRVLQHYVEHRREIVRRRSEFELTRARERAHILEGLLKALDVLDEVIQTIRRSETTDTARTNLIRKFKFTELQAQAILDMPLKRLAALERKRLKEEYQALLERIAYLEDLLAHPHKVLAVIKQELTALKERYGDARRTRIVEAGVSRDSLTVTDLIEDEPVLIYLARSGVLMREPLGERRRGKLPSKVDGQPPLAIAAGTARDEVLLFAADGRMARLPAHRLPDGAEVHPEELGTFARGDRLAALLVTSRPEEDRPRYLVLATREGRVKRVALADAWSVIAPTTAMAVEEGDELVGAAIGDESSEILLVTRLGQAIRFKESEVRPMGLPAAGVWGIKLSSGDEVVSLSMARPAGELLIATAAGYAKRTALEEYPVQGRHGAGVAAIRLTQTSGSVADACVVLPGDEVFTASRRGTLRKLELSEVPLARRAASGKQVVQPAQGDGLVRLLHLPTARPRGGATGAARPEAPAEAALPQAAEDALSAGQLSLPGLTSVEPAPAPAGPRPAEPAAAAKAAKARAAAPAAAPKPSAKPARAVELPAIGEVAPKPIRSAKATAAGAAAAAPSPAKPQKAKAPDQTASQTAATGAAEATGAGKLEPSLKPAAASPKAGRRKTTAADASAAAQPAGKRKAAAAPAEPPAAQKPAAAGKSGAQAGATPKAAGASTAAKPAKAGASKPPAAEPARPQKPADAATPSKGKAGKQPGSP